MAEARFDLVILHHTSDKSVENLVQELLVLLDKVGDPYLEYKLSEALLFEQSSSAILDDVDEQSGKQIQEQFRTLRVETELRPTLQLVAKEKPESDKNAEQYVCPSCGHNQAKQTQQEVMDTCNKCGLVGEKLQKNQRKEEIYQLEKRKLEQTQTKKMREAVDRARYDEEETLRKEAQERLGLKDKNRTTNVLVGVGVVAAMGVASYFIADTLRNSDENKAIKDTVVAEKTTAKDKKPIITIQAGNGSVVINNAKEQGTGGAKGTADQVTSSIPGGSGDSGQSFDTVSMSNQQHAQTDKAADADSTTVNQTMQLASVNKTDTPDSNAVTQQTIGAVAKTVLPSNITSTPDELKELKAILTSDPKAPLNFLSKLNEEQLREHSTRLDRLLSINKPDLALVFAEDIDDSYSASRMVLKVAKYETERQSIELYDDLLMTMKSLAASGDSLQSKALLNSSLSQIYAITGDKEAAQALLEESMLILNKKSIQATERYRLLAQIEKDHRQFGSASSIEFISKAFKEYAETLPAEEYLNINRAYTHLAAAALSGAQADEADNWLRKIPVIDARQHLLTHLETMKTEQAALKQ